MAEPVLVVKHSEDWIRFKIKDGWVIVVQQVPPRPSKPQQTTCALPHCKYDGHYFVEYTFRVSFEPQNQWKKDHLVQKPAIASMAEGREPEMGTTATRSFWYHLDCFEGIFDLFQEPEDKLIATSSFIYFSDCIQELLLPEPFKLTIMCPAADQSVTSAIPLAEFAKSIFAETRGYGPINTNYSLGYELHYLLEKWTGVRRYEEYIDEHGIFDVTKAMTVNEDKLTIIDRKIYTSIFAVFRRDIVEGSFHFRGVPSVLTIDENLKQMRLSQVLTTGEPWAWQIARIDELCQESRKIRRLNGQKDTGTD